MSNDSYTVTVEAGDSTDEFELPADAITLLSEQGDTPANVVSDLAVLSIAQQLHGAVHHTQGEVDEVLEAAEEDVLETFEERFGQSFAEMTGHDH